MLYHHDSRSYEEAASEAGKKGREILEGQIERGRANAMSVLEKISTEIPNDQVVPGPAMRFIPASDGVEVSIGRDAPASQIHKHALGQFASRGGMPMTFIAKLREIKEGDPEVNWAHELIAHNFNELYSKGPAARKNYLSRSIDTEVRGFLSDKYRRLDSRPLVESFTGAMQKFGALPVQGYALDTKVGLKAILPVVFEPVPNEIFSYGLYWENSDFGDGAHTVRGFLNRLWCTNMAITEETMRQIHVGKRLSGDFSYSSRTYQLDTKTAASAIEDIVEHLLDPENIQKVCAGIKAAHEEEVSPLQVKGFLKKHLQKGEAEEVTRVFNSADIVNVPAGQTKWRLSNAVSWVAGQMDDRHRALDLMKVAGKAVA